MSMGGIAASGGYYVAMAVGEAENTIFAEPTTWTGSIGVIIPHYDISGLLQKWNIQDDSIASNPLKMMGSPTAQVSRADRSRGTSKSCKGLVDSSFRRVQGDRAGGPPGAARQPGRARDDFYRTYFHCQAGQENLLVDQLGFVEDAIDRAVEMAALDKYKVRVVKYEQHTGLFQRALFGAEGRKPAIDLSAVWDLAVPRAYYMCTWLPGIGGM